MPVVRNCIASIVRRANLTYSASVKLNFGGVADMRSGGSVLEAPPGAEEGALPASIVRKPAVQNLREHRPRAAYTNCLHTQKRLSGIPESLFCMC